ncbi:hypothetical protein [Aeromicrobium sp. UC242_57]|uniref:hypothetical protein n=1 Tax=Aeromicrobium sp. UC242_57 TaxID=3374624 RepID=UPI0037AA7AD5
MSFADLERAKTVVLVGFEPEDENGSIFLRLRKGARDHGLKVIAIASHASRGLVKLSGERPDRPRSGAGSAGGSRPARRFDHPGR